jgi:hypothetical protein
MGIEPAARIFNTTQLQPCCELSICDGIFLKT